MSWGERAIISELRSSLVEATKIAKRLSECPGLCDPECYGRCRVCPYDVASKLVQFLEKSTEGGK